MELRTMEPIRTALRALMNGRHMTDTEVWVAAGISPGALSRYLGGSRGTTAIDWRGAQTIEKLATVFGLPPSYFVEYRIWQVREIAKKHPALVDEVYDLLVAHAAAEDKRAKHPA
jgi:transcriptional regulator with XRE-family HTH domain